MYCPKDFKPCMDDFCRGGGGCFKLHGEPLLEKCPGCGAWISDEDNSDCECPPYEMTKEEEEYWDEFYRAEEG